MIHQGIRIDPVSETSLILTLGDEIDIALAPRIGRISRRIQECMGVCEVTPSYTTILVEVGITNTNFERLSEQLLKIARDEFDSNNSLEACYISKLIELPVYYHQEVGPDLTTLAEYSQLSIDEVIAIHSGREYTVCAIGFAPGFAFLADVDTRIVMPRRERPRLHVAAGSVGITGRQTAVYPNGTPGGWQIIGNCPLSLFEHEESIFTVGNRVRFVPIDRKMYLMQGGHV